MKVFVLIRDNSPYTLCNFVLGVFETKELAAAARAEYIQKRAEADTFGEQLYFDVDLERDMFVQVIEDAKTSPGEVVLRMNTLSCFGMVCLSVSGTSSSDESFVRPDEYSVTYELNRLYEEEEIPDSFVLKDIQDYLSNSFEN